MKNIHILPKEEPKQETLEEVAERILHRNEVGDEDMILCSTFPNTIKSMVEMAKWQQERSYSEEEAEEFAIGFAEWICQKADISTIDGKMNTTLEIYKKERGL